MFKPLLAVEADLDKLVYPVLASPKFDGIRCCVVGNQAVSRNGKPIVNAKLRRALETYAINTDGELVWGDPTANNCFNLTTSIVMTKDADPLLADSGWPHDHGLRFFLFDVIGMPKAPYEERLDRLHDLYHVHGSHAFPWIVPVTQVVINDRAELEAYEEQMVQAGWEGIMLRRPDGPYKYGRSTKKEGILLKVKRFADDEAVITGFEELYRNANQAERDAWGHLTRGTSKEGLVPAGTLGALEVECQGRYKGVRFSIGSGFTQAQREIGRAHV